MKNKKTYIFIVLYLIVAYLTIFNHLASNPLREFDEARMGISAYEMLQTKNPIVVNFLNEPDLWNTKPPLVIWIETISTKIFGLGEFAIRLPSAIALCLTGLLLLLFGIKLQRHYVGLISSLLLLCSWDLVFWHCGRTADYDAFLLLFNTAYILSFWLYFQDISKNKYLILFFIFLTLASLTKDVAAFIPIPILFLYVLFNKQFVNLLKNKYFWIGVSIFIVCFGGFLLIREQMSEGYIQALWNNDAMGRYTKALENSPTSKFFYFIRFYKYTFKYLFIYVPIAFLFNIFSKDKTIKNLNYYLFSIVLFMFLILAFSKTKLDWYAYPIVPMICVVLAICIDSFKNKLINGTNKAQKIIIHIMLFLIFLAIPLADNIFSYKGSFSLTVEHDGSNYPYPNYMKLLKKHKQDIINKKIDNLYFLQTEWPLDSYYYYLMFKEKGVNVYYKPDIDNLSENIYAVTITTPESNKVLQQYSYEEIYTYGEGEDIARIIKIKQKKQ